MISEVDLNDNSEICSKKILYQLNEVDNTESDENIDISNKIKRIKENDDVNICKGCVLKKFEDEFGNEYPAIGGKTGYDACMYYDNDD
jgi:hypothetical protein